MAGEASSMGGAADRSGSGETGESGRVEDPWRRIETERPDRERASRAHDATHDPGETFEKSHAELPERDRSPGRFVPETTVDALRAFLREDSDTVDRAMARMRVDGTADTFPRAMAAAMLVLLERRLGSTPTLADIVSVVARLRSDHHINDELDVHPITTEKMVRAGYGDAAAIAGLDQEELATVQTFLISDGRLVRGMCPGSGRKPRTTRVVPA